MYKIPDDYNVLQHIAQAIRFTTLTLLYITLDLYMATICIYKSTTASDSIFFLLSFAGGILFFFSITRILLLYVYFFFLLFLFGEMGSVCLLVYTVSIF